MVFKRKTIFDILREAEEDNTTEVETDQKEEQDAAPSPEESGEPADDTEDDEFNIDANLDDDGAEDNNDLDTDTSGADTSDSTSTETDNEEEANDDNTNIFSSLSAEEQKIKITELKKLFNDLYSSTDDIMQKMNDIVVNDENSESVNRLTSSLYSLRRYIAEYIVSIFPNKSYIENDIAFNRFLSLITSISVIIEEINKKKDQKTK